MIEMTAAEITQVDEMFYFFLLMSVAFIILAVYFGSRDQLFLSRLFTTIVSIIWGSFLVWSLFIRNFLM